MNQVKQEVEKVFEGLPGGVLREVAPAPRRGAKVAFEEAIKDWVPGQGQRAKSATFFLQRRAYEVRETNEQVQEEVDKVFRDSSSNGPCRREYTLRAEVDERLREGR